MNNKQTGKELYSTGNTDIRCDQNCSKKTLPNSIGKTINHNSIVILTTVGVGENPTALNAKTLQVNSLNITTARISTSAGIVNSRISI